MISKNFNWGIIGPGRISQNFAKTINSMKNVTLYSIASSNKERADKFAKLYNVEKVYYSYKEMLKDPNLDVVYIATPHRFHYENVKLCLEHNKHVLCEKPFTVKSSQAAELIAFAKEQNLFLMEALWTRFLPIYNVVKSWMSEGLIGEIKLLNATMGFNFPFDVKDRIYNHELAGGALLDLGVYPIAISQWITEQNPSSFSAHSTIGKTNVDIMTLATLEYENDIYSQISCNVITKNKNEFIIYGNKGYIIIHDMFWAATKASLVRENKIITELRPFKTTGFEYQIEEVTKCLSAEKIESSIMPLKDTLNNIKLMDAIRNEIGLKYNFE